MSSSSQINVNKLQEYLIHQQKFLNYLDNYYDFYKTTNSDNKSVSKISSSSLYRQLLDSKSSLSEKIDRINSLPDLNNSELKHKKTKLMQAIIDLDILTMCSDTNNFIHDELTYIKQEKTHSPLEKWFNELCNSSFIILKLNNKIYNLELDSITSSITKPSSTTFYNYLPDTINGTLSLWDMKISTEKYQELVDLSSSDNEDELGDNYDINNRDKLNDFAFSSKSEFMEILKDLHGQSYTTLYFK